MIRTIEEVLMDRIKECLPEVQARFHRSYGIVLGVNKDREFEALGSFFFLAVDGARYLVTAAHVIDLNKDYDLKFSGSEKTVTMEGAWQCTVPPGDDRTRDNLDIAYYKLSPNEVDAY